MGACGRESDGHLSFSNRCLNPKMVWDLLIYAAQIQMGLLHWTAQVEVATLADSFWKLYSIDIKIHDGMYAWPIHHSVLVGCFRHCCWVNPDPFFKEMYTLRMKRKGFAWRHYKSVKVKLRSQRRVVHTDLYVMSDFHSFTAKFAHLLICWCLQRK